MERKDLGKALREIRKKFGYTQQQIANALNMERSTYTCYETGKTLPDIFTLISLSNIFQLSLDNLLDYFTVHADKLERINHSAIFYLSKQELQLLVSYRAMSETKQHKLLQLLSSPLSEDLF